MAPLSTTDTSFPYVTVQVSAEEYQKLDHFRSSDCQPLPDEPVEYNTLDCSLPGRNIQHRTRNNNEGNPDYSTLPGQVSRRCNNNTELTNTHNTDNISGYSCLPVTEKGQFTQCYTNMQCYMFSTFCSLQLQVCSGQSGISYTSQVGRVW